MKSIPLYRTGTDVIVSHVLVDDEDALLDQFTWGLFDGQAQRTREGETIRMRDSIARRAGMVMSRGIEFVTRDKLDLRRANIQSVPEPPPSPSVIPLEPYWSTSYKDWEASIKVNGIVIQVGHFPTQIRAQDHTDKYFTTETP